MKGTKWSAWHIESAYKNISPIFKNFMVIEENDLRDQNTQV